MTNKENMRTILSNKMAVIQVLGGLLKNPLLLSEHDYKLTQDDFPERFHVIVFGAISWLASEGAETITPVDLDQFLARYPNQYKVFVDNQGFDYVSRCIDIAELKNFGLYYKQLKKYNALYKFYEAGIGIKEFYDPDETDPSEIAKKQTKLDNISLEDLISHFEGKVAAVGAEFTGDADVEEYDIWEGIRDTLKSFKEEGDMGEPYMSPLQTALFRGQRLQKVVLESSSSGGGKSRKALGEAARLAIPEYFDWNTKQWMAAVEPHHNAVLYVSTELQREEIHAMVLAFVSGIPENVIRDGAYTWEQEEVLDRAINYLEHSTFKCVYLPDYDIADAERLIKKYKQLYNVRYVYFDYLMSTFKMMLGTSQKGYNKNLREDQYLLDAVAKLKRLANKLQVFIHTSTQLNREYGKQKEVNETVLRGATALADKVDNGVIMLEPRDDDLPIIEEYMRKGYTTRPNIVLHIFKMRQVNKIHVKKAKLYGYFDYGTCRFEDCFLTDLKGNILDVAGEQVQKVVIDLTEEEKKQKEESINKIKSKWGDFEL